MKKIIENWKIVGFTDLEPILSEGQIAEEAEAGEYEAWLEEQK